MILSRENPRSLHPERENKVMFSKSLVSTSSVRSNSSTPILKNSKFQSPNYFKSNAFDDINMNSGDPFEADFSKIYIKSFFKNITYIFGQHQLDMTLEKGGQLDKETLKLLKKRFLKENLKGINGLFIDYEFPPCLAILVPNPNKQVKASKFKQIKWYKPVQIYPQGYFLWEKITPYDTKIGSLLNNSYFVSGICALVSTPNGVNRIIAIFQQKVVQQIGQYVFTFCINGEFQRYLIDDFLPFDMKTMQLAFIQDKTNRPYIYISLLEKAWAKANGSYEYIEYDYINELLHSITGAPILYLSIKGQSKKHFYDKITYYLKRQFTVCLGDVKYKQNSKKTYDVNTQNKIGLRIGYSYPVLNITPLIINNKQKMIFLCRNPLGTKEIIKKLNKDILDQLPQITQDPGLFYISYPEVAKNFNRVDVCLINEKYSYTSYKVQQMPQTPFIYKMNVKKDGEYFLSINLSGKRQWVQAAKYKITPKSILIVGQDMQNGFFQILGHSINGQKENWCCLNLKQGEYIIFTYISTCYQMRQNNVVISSYGVDSVFFTHFKKCDNIISPFMQSYGIYRGRQKVVMEQNQHNTMQNRNKDIIQEYIYDDIIIIDYYYNKTAQWYIQSYKFRSLKGILTLLPPFVGETNEIVIGPNQEIALVRFVEYSYKEDSIKKPKIKGILSDSQPWSANKFYESIWKSPITIIKKQGEADILPKLDTFITKQKQVNEKQPLFYMYLKPQFIEDYSRDSSDNDNEEEKNENSDDDSNDNESSINSDSQQDDEDDENDDNYHSDDDGSELSSDNSVDSSL